MTSLHKVSAGLLFLLLAGQGIFLARTTGQTVDESYYNGISYPVVRHHDYTNLTEHPPLMMQLAGLPLLAMKLNDPFHEPVYQAEGVINIAATGDKFLYQSGNPPYRILFAERLVILAVMLLLAAALFFWARDLYGPGGALLALGLMAFDPNMLAHGSLFTTDMGAAAFFFIAVWRLDRALLTGSRRDTVFAGLACGLALLTKISTLILYPLSILFFLAAGRLRPAPSGPDSEKIDWGLLAAGIGFFILCAGQKVMLALLGPVCMLAFRLALEPALKKNGKVIGQIALRLAFWTGYAVIVYCAHLLIRKQPLLGKALFAWTIFAFGFSVWLSRRAGSAGLQKKFCAVWFIAFSVVALAYTDYAHTLLRFNAYKFYVENFIETFDHTRSGHLLYIPGSFITCDWKYFPAAMLVKTPLGTLLLAAAGILALSLRAPQGRSNLRHEIASSALPPRNDDLTKLTVLFPPAAFLATASFLNTIKIGLRHVLPVYPFLFLAAGALVPFLISQPRGRARAAGILIAALVLIVPIESLWEFPHYLSFFNAAAGGSENGVRLLGDSNFNWGQDNRSLTEFVKAKGIGHIKISARTLHSAEYDYARIPWSPMSEQEDNSPAPGWYALDRAEYEQRQSRPDSWFRGRPPAAHVGRTYYIFHVEPANFDSTINPNS